MPDPREDKLAKWAQQELASLRYQIKTLQKWQDNALGSQTDTGVSWSDHEPSNPPFPLPRSSRVTWSFGPGMLNEISVYEDLNGKLTVSAGRRLAIHPMASNVVQFTPEA